MTEEVEQAQVTKKQGHELQHKELGMNSYRSEIPSLAGLRQYLDDS